MHPQRRWRQFGNSAQARRSESGFTLIELLVTITILGILAAVVVFAVSGINDRGERSARAADERVLRTALEAYCARHKKYAEIPELKNEKFLADDGLPRTVYHTVTTGSDEECGEGDDSSYVISGNETTVVDSLDIPGLGPAHVAVDTDTNAVYVSNIQSENVSIFDGNTNQHVANVPTGSGNANAKWITVNPNNNKVYASYTNNIAVIDGTDPANPLVLETISTAGNVSAPMVVTSTGNVYARTNSTTYVIDGASDSASTVDLGLPQPHLAAGGSRAYAVGSTSGPGVIKIIDAGGAIDEATFNSTEPGCTQNPAPSAVCELGPVSNMRQPKVDAAVGRVFLHGRVSVATPSGTANARSKVWVLNAATGAVISSYREADSTPNSSVGAYNPNTRRLHVALDVAGAFPVRAYDVMADPAVVDLGIAPLPGPPSAVSVDSDVAVVNPNTNRLYLALFQPNPTLGSPGGLAVLDVSGTFDASGVLAGANIRGIAVNPNTNRVYAIDANGPTLHILE
ncbi:MAG: prepilin-type N-terminal cleavage/methylation domain-containing protein [Solirubrobacteraceae bacterium]|nr:prepilin-type N-terminal cleavage/methylation domain-containing protein [Solirubrobacteraceae bacterium]